jgi:hypothetical protein
LDELKKSLNVPKPRQFFGARYNTFRKETSKKINEKEQLLLDAQKQLSNQEKKITQPSGTSIGGNFNPLLKNN